MRLCTTAAKLLLAATIVASNSAYATFDDCENDFASGRIKQTLPFGALDQYENAALPADLIEHATYGSRANPALVLVPGIGGSLLWSQKFVNDLSKSFFVITYSQRGHGLTPSVGMFHSSLLAKDVSSLLDHYQIKKTYIYGFSMGVRTAVRFASDFRDRTMGVFIGDMHLKKITHGKAFADAKGLEDVLPLMPASYDDATSYVKTLRAFSAGMFGKYLKVDPEIDGKLRYNLSLYYYQALSEDLSESLAQVHAANIPILAFRGEKGKRSVLVGVGVDHLLKHAPSAKLIEQDGVSHGGHYGRAGEEMVAEFNMVHDRVRFQEALRNVNLDAFDNQPLPTQLVEYKILGKKGAPTVLFIHGLGGGMVSWERGGPVLLAKLAEKYQLVVYSLRGHYGTAAVGKNYSMEILAADAAHLIQTLNLGKVHVIGHSMGARIGAQLAADHPDLVRSLLVEDMHFKGVKHARSLAQLMSDTELMLKMPGSFANKDELIAALPEGLSDVRRYQILDDDNLNFGADGRIRLRGWHYLESGIGVEMSR